MAKYLWIALGLVVILLVGGAVWYFDIEFEEVEVEIGPGPEANRNPYLAIEQLLNRLSGEDSFEAQRGMQLLANLPGHEDTIIIDSKRESLTQNRIAALIDWVSQGGHLILLGRPNYGGALEQSGDRLLSHYKVKVINGDYDEYDNDDEDSKPESAKTIAQRIAQNNARYAIDCPDNLLMTELSLDSAAPIAININSVDSLLYSGPQRFVSLSGENDYGIQLLQLTSGKGKVTVLTDMAHWQNQDIACYDNAYALVRLTEDSNKTWLLYYEEVPSILQLLWQNATTLVLSFALFVGLWIWSQTLSLGLKVSSNRTIRRNYLEHLAAAARYRRYSGESDALIAMLRQKIVRALILRHQQFAQMTQQEQLELICRLCHINKQDAHQAMFAEVPARNEALVTLVQKLQQLRKQLC